MGQQGPRVFLSGDTTIRLLCSLVECTVRSRPGWCSMVLALCMVPLCKARPVEAGMKCYLNDTAVMSAGVLNLQVCSCIESVVHAGCGPS
jgi:hypothetical protein